MVQLVAELHSQTAPPLHAVLRVVKQVAAGPAGQVGHGRQVLVLLGFGAHALGEDEEVAGYVVVGELAGCVCEIGISRVHQV